MISRSGQRRGRPVLAAGGIIGAQAVARATPDGYTYLFSGGGTLITNVYAFKSLPYDPVKDFTPVSQLARFQFGVVSGPASNVKSVAEMLAKAKADGYTLLLGDQTSVIARPMVEELPYSWEDFKPVAQINDSPVLMVVPGDSPYDTVEDFVEGQLSQPLERHFPETGYAVEGDFLRYWDANGGQESFGYPISPELEENGVKTQYFQRARFQSAEGPDLGNHNVLVTHSGSHVSRERVRDVPYRSVRGASSDYCGHPPTSRHSVCGGFQETREASDEQIVAVNPISPEYRERDPSTGETFIVQYVEHRRLTRSRRIGSRTTRDTLWSSKYLQATI
jgi:hypothetical protein